MEGRGDTGLSQLRRGRLWPVEGRGPWDTVGRGVREMREEEEDCRPVLRADGGREREKREAVGQ